MTKGALAMSLALDVEIERVLLELDQMCETLERRGWYAQAADAEQLYANLHRRIGRPMPGGRSSRLMRELMKIGQPVRRTSGLR